MISSKSFALLSWRSLFLVVNIRPACNVPRIRPLTYAPPAVVVLCCVADELVEVRAVHVNLRIRMRVERTEELSERSTISIAARRHSTVSIVARTRAHATMSTQRCARNHVVRSASMPDVTNPVPLPVHLVKRSVLGMSEGFGCFIKVVTYYVSFFYTVGVAPTTPALCHAAP